MIRLRPSGADEVLIKRVRDWYEPGPGVFIAPQALFNPALLFTTGVNGTWYDPSDLNTLFQDAAGTTPVTSVEQPVGLMLDKSKGLVLGSELVINGDFSNGTTGWTSADGSTTLAIVSGQLELTCTGAGYGSASPTTAPLASVGGGVRVSAYLSSGASIALGDGTTYNKWGTYSSADSGTTKFFSATGAIYLTLLTNSNIAGTKKYFDNISVRELPGNHAFNPSGNSANFPVLSARYNLLTKTEDVTDVAVWNYKVNSSSVDYQTISFSGVGRFGRSTGLATGVQYTYSVEVKAGTKTGTVQLEDPNNSGSWTPITLTNNWQRLAISYTPTNLPYISVSSTDGNIGTVLVRNWDMRVSNDALNQPAYQRVNTATDYDTAGFKPYLKFNGTNQWLQTNSIDFSYGDKMFVCAGVRKLSDASGGVVSELSVNSGANNGSFTLYAPRTTATADYGFRSYGNLNVGDATSAASYASPTTSVLSGLGGISVDQSVLRINGAQVATSAADQGTGNFGNYPLYIGVRAGISLWFNGRLHQLVVAGKQASASEIGQTEAFTNQKTGAY